MMVMELLQWHKVWELGGDKLHRPPVVALIANPCSVCRDQPVCRDYFLKHCWSSRGLHKEVSLSYIYLIHGYLNDGVNLASHS